MQEIPITRYKHCDVGFERHNLKITDILIFPFSGICMSASCFIFIAKVAGLTNLFQLETGGFQNW